LSLVDSDDLAKAADTEKDEWRGAQELLEKAIERFGAAVESTG
jgi:hypothetical protein